MRGVAVAAILILSLAAVGCRTFPTVRPDQPVVAIDSGGRAITALQAGSSLELRADRLTPRATYEFRVSLSGRPGESDTFLSLARTSTDANGTIASFILWYQSGVIGCATRRVDETRPLRFRGFDEADAALRGRTLRITAQHVPRAERMSELAAGPAQGPVAFEMTLPIETRRSPMVYPSDRTGCLVNSVQAESQDLWVSGRNFAPGETVAISVVPNQRAWYAGDRVVDVTGPSFAAAPKRVTADANGRFLVRGWEAANHRRGVYDIVAQRLDGRRRDLSHIDLGDVISYGSDTGVILYSLYPVGGPTMDLAGRPIDWPPYFEYADSFADTGDSVWGAVDPTYIPSGHPGGLYAGYYVVTHRSVAEWDPTMGGSISIADQSSDGVNVMPVKAGCINASDTIIWPAPVPVGQYDVVVDFGTLPASTAAAYVPDGQYNAIPDFLDGADQIGFVVVKDPYDLGTIPVGRSSYSFDDFFATLGGASNVDLRAVVRYPAVSAGVDTNVAAGAHPLFVIEHGNHGICRICTDNTLYYDRQKQVVAGTISWSTFGSLCSYTHVTCPDRTKNHEGYMRLLETLASHGVIAVSIDAYDLTGPVPGWINERADLILKHLEFWAHANNAAQFATYPDPFSGRFLGKVDMTKVSVSGHSRGGEASVRAYLNNAALPTPFSINSVSSIAPVDVHGSVLPAVPYFVVLPAADGDVSSLSGAPIYDRAGSGVADATTKAGIWVYGANHNFFNTVWAADWDDWTDSHPSWPARPDFIPAADQQRLGEAYLTAFARVYLKNETVYEDMLRGNLTFPSTAGRKIYHFRHETNHSKLDAGSGAGVATGGLTQSSVNPSVHATQAVRLGWASSAAVYTYAVPPAQQNVSTYEVLSFRAAQTNSAANPASGSQDFQVELVGGGNTKGVYMGKFDAVPKPYDRVGADHNVMTTVRIPLHSFIINQSGVTLNSVDTVRFRFLSPTSGEIYVDDVEFSR